MSTELDRRIEMLERHLDSAPTVVTTDTDRSKTNIYIVGAIIPLLTWMVLYFWKPSIVRNAKDDHEKVNNTKVFFYSVLFTALAWAALYLLAKHTSVGRFLPL
jgi:hypothetical protein